MTLPAWVEWLTGGLLASILAVVGLFWKIRHERDENLQKAKVAAVEAAESAVKVVKEAMDTQAEQITRLTQQVTDKGQQITQLTQQVTDQGGQITDLTTKVSTLDRSHQVAIRHIAEREGWALDHWEDRPQSLPAIPSMIVADVIAINPSLQRRYRAPRSSKPDPVEDDPGP